MADPDTLPHAEQLGLLMLRSLGNEVRELRAERDDLRSQRDGALSLLEQALADLAKYGGHTDECALRRGGRADGKRWLVGCDCGWSDRG